MTVQVAVVPQLVSGFFSLTIPLEVISTLVVSSCVMPAKSFVVSAVPEAFLIVSSISGVLFVVPVASAHVLVTVNRMLGLFSYIT